MQDNYFNKVTFIAVLAVLTVLSFLLLRPILMSIIFGFVLVFIFAPVYNLIQKKIKAKNISALIITAILLAIIVVPLIFLAPLMLNEAIKLFTLAQQTDVITPLQNLFSFFSVPDFSLQANSIIYSFVTKVTTSLFNSVSNFLINIPNMLLQLTVTLFTFFFVIRDKKEFMDYVKSVMPFPSDVKERLIKVSRDVTASVLYGQIVIGLMQGLITGIGFFLFGVSNALLFTALAIIAGILPIVGPAIVWIPVAIYLFVSGNTFAAIGIIIFGIASVVLDHLLRPIIVSRRILMNPLLVLLGMVGGMLFFGLLGFVLGPLIIAYLLIFLELYKNKRFSGLIATPNN